MVRLATAPSAVFQKANHILNRYEWRDVTLTLTLTLTLIASRHDSYHFRSARLLHLECSA